MNPTYVYVNRGYPTLIYVILCSNHWTSYLTSINIGLSVMNIEDAQSHVMISDVTFHKVRQWKRWKISSCMTEIFHSFFLLPALEAVMIHLTRTTKTLEDVITRIQVRKTFIYIAIAINLYMLRHFSILTTLDLLWFLPSWFDA